MTPEIEQWMSDAAWEIYQASSGEIRPDWIQKVISSHASKIEHVEVENWLRDYAGFRPEKWDRIKEWLASHAPRDLGLQPALASHDSSEDSTTWLKAAQLAAQFGEIAMDRGAVGAKHPEASEAAEQPTPLANYLSHTYEFSTQEDAVKAMKMGKEIADGIKAEIEHDPLKEKE